MTLALAQRKPAADQQGLIDHDSLAENRGLKEEVAVLKSENATLKNMPAWSSHFRSSARGSLAKVVPKLRIC